MDYFVFNITESCDRDNTIDEKKISNLDKIIVSILGQSGNGLPGEIQHFKISDTDESNKIRLLRDQFLDQHKVDFPYETFITGIANDLLKAELVEEKDGSKRRNKRITPGILIIKHEKGRLSLLKLEETSSIDKLTYELKSAFMTDRRYYKAAIISNRTMNIIDKNRKVANYWAYDFLHLERENNDKENTNYLISKIISDELVTKKISDCTLRKTVSDLLREHVLLDTRFEPDEWLEEINNSISSEGISFKRIEDIFSDEALEFLDESFVIDKKIARQKLKTEIEIGPDLKIEAINIGVAIRAQKILYDEGYIQIQVPEESRDRIRQLFIKMR